jgi:colanic acid biosynthesis glycosyl transferase WcaI
MNILLVTDAYPPEIRSSSHLMLELAEELRDRGHRLTVLTSWPRYNLSAPDAAAGLGEKETADGITVIRVHTLPHHKVNFVVRGIAQLVMPRQFLRALRRHSREKFDAVIVYSPPLPLAMVGRALRKRGAKFVLNIQDLFPQNAIDLGVLSNPLLIAMFRAIERRAYRAADSILVHSISNLEFLKRDNPRAAGKLGVLHNWVDAKEYRLPAGTRFRERYGLEGKFIIGFPGVMGPSQQLDLIIRAAAKLRAVEDLAFLFVGDGGELDNLKRLAAELGATNVHFHPFIPREDYPELLKNLDIGLVCLSPRNHTPVVPGKLLTYMAAALPVLAVLNRESDGNQIVRDADCGLAVPSDDEAAIAAAITELHEARDKLAAWGENGQAYADKHFDKAAVIAELEGYLR